MSFIIRNKTAGAIAITDMGFTLPASADFDLTPEDPRHVATSTDLTNNIGLGNIVVLDPLDGVTELSAAASQEIVEVHNDPHYRIRGGELNQLDDVDTTGASTNDVLQLNGSGVYVPVTPDTIVGDASDAINQQIANVLVDGTDTTVVATGSPVTSIQVNVDDVFLRNTGDTLDSGTLTIASGAAVNFPSGSSLTIQDGATATIITPTGGFVGDTAIVNKAYVDNVAAGLDPKESVRAATTTDVGGSYTATGSPTGTGDNIAGASGVIDGVTLQTNDRVLVKNQTDPQQNGIYVVQTVNAGSPVTVDLLRAEDQNGNPTSEVSAGNFTFVEQGTENANTGWVVSGDGALTLNTDNIVWVQFSESTDFQAGDGIALTGNTFSLDVNDLTVATITTSDEVAFNDVDDANTTRKTTVANFLSDLDVVSGITTNGFIVRTADDTYVSRSVVASSVDDRAGIEVLNGSGVSGNPTVGLDIETLPYITAGSPGGSIEGTDRVPVYDVDLDRNVYYTINDIAGALSATDSFTTWAGAGNTTGDASVVADGSTDTVTLTGGTGINIDFTAASDTLTFDLSFDAINAGTGTIGDTDEFIVNDGGSIVKYTFADLKEDLDVPSVTGEGIVVKTQGSPDQWSARSIAISGVGNEDGLIITNGDGVAGDPTLGLDITGTPAAGEDLAANDELIGYNTSGTANEKFTGQEVADGVATILGISNLSVQAIGGSGSPGEQQLFVTDAARSKDLSVAEFTVSYSESTVGNSDWLEVGGANDASSGYIIPYNATLVRATAHSASVSSAKGIDLYVDGVATSPLITIPTGGDISDGTLDVDINAEQKVRLRGASSGGTIGDTIITLWFRWRT